MDVPITRPSMVSYAEDLDFHELLEKLLADEHNGFIRITVKEHEGYIIFKDGRQVAAEYHKYSKTEAVEKIISAAKEDGTLIEVFDMRSSHMDYIMDLNKPYALETDHDLTVVLEKLKEKDEPEKLVPEKITKQENTDFPTENKPPGEVEAPKPEPELEPVPEPEPEIPEPNSVVETPTSESEPQEEISPRRENFHGIVDSMKSGEAEPQEDEVQDEPLDRSKLLAKYGIREMDEDDVDQLLDTYKGGSLSNEDVEKIELNLMNKIKKSIFGIPKIKGAEVMVFLQSSQELSGYINIIIEYGGKSIISRFMGESQNVENLRRQVINIAQIEIKKSFRKYPQVVEKFNINVEIS